MTLPRRQFERAFHPRVVAVVGDKAMNGFVYQGTFEVFGVRPRARERLRGGPYVKSGLYTGYPPRG